MKTQFDALGNPSPPRHTGVAGAGGQRPASTFSQFVRDAVPAADAGRGFDRWCPACRRVTRWQMVSIVAGQQVGRCGECEMEMVYERK